MDVGVEIKNQYRVVEHIGRGGMADVWSARDTRLNRMVAIKTIAYGLTADTNPVELFEREAQTIAQLEHPHILPIYDFGEFQGQLYIVMRYVTGGSLENLLERGPMAAADVMKVGEAIAQALDHAHANKVIHLDLKPPNILLDSHSTPYLADFGLATQLDREGRAQNPGAGTLLYMAPEQLTANVLDHRADIYAFAVMLYHMFTGQLPFDATTSLALKQLQFQEEIPDIDQVSSDLPKAITMVLRRGTALNPDDRFPTVMALMEDLREVLADAAAAGISLEGGELDFGEADSYALDLDPALVAEDTALLEAVDLYSRARYAWSGGRGRFLLGVSHFMLMNGYYMQAEKYGLSLDEAGRQLLLRGALEFDHEIDYWWSQLDDANRRWVCLHAIRSANAPTRIRALYRLETLPDADPPQIPKLVAQALQVEVNEDAKLAALQVLGTRAKLVSPGQSYDIKTEYRGRMLTTMTRIGVQLRAPSVWQEAIYSPEIDLLLAAIALDEGMPRVAEFAARTIGRIRSLTAVRSIAHQQRHGVRGALRALALVRDEAPSLPSVVSPQGRLYAWLANTWRRLSDRPMGIVWRYVFAVLGGWLAMGMHVFTVFRTQAIFIQQRWANAVAIGLVFAVLVGTVALAADEFPTRLRGFWTWWARLALSLVMGTLLGMLTWWSFPWFFLNLQPGQDILLFGGLGLALGYVLTTMLRLPGWLAVIVTTITTYIPIYVTFQVGWMGNPIPPFQFYEALLYYDFATPEQIFTVALPFALIVALGGHAPALLRDARWIWARVRRPAKAARRTAALALSPEQADFAGQAPTVPGKTPAAPRRAPLVTEVDAQFGAYDAYPEDTASLMPAEEAAQPAPGTSPAADLDNMNTLVDIQEEVKRRYGSPGTERDLTHQPHEMQKVSTEAKPQTKPEIPADLDTMNTVVDIQEKFRQQAADLTTETDVSSPAEDDDER